MLLQGRLTRFGIVYFYISKNTERYVIRHYAQK